MNISHAANKQHKGEEIMKRIISIACLVVMMLSLSQLAGALTYTFEPDDGGRKGANSSGTSNMSNDLWDLDHGYKYTWASAGNGLKSKKL